ncbi:scrapie-responsive protein 1-like isoform X2 [Scleropages formosus]|nr:scrapie-responsive protein 1 isoform X2 [Scleropages formosus]XP_029114966.1 scrapie-responsive protein 1 isoform X2 [Scleropages formosus]XP_029114967.1 scrapie-responsive protein 1 isoform X2 [Scleropages formosus]
MMNVSKLSVILLLLGLLACNAIPSNMWSCNKKMLKERDCHSLAGVGDLSPIESLHGHFWGGDRCDTVCYCNFRELLCCPSDVFFGPRVSFVIPCQKGLGGISAGEARLQRWEAKHPPKTLASMDEAHLSSR